MRADAALGARHPAHAQRAAMRRVEYLNGLGTLLNAEASRVCDHQSWAPLLRATARTVGTLVRHTTLKARRRFFFFSSLCCSPALDPRPPGASDAGSILRGGPSA